jgi:hypothetical protein
VNEKCMDDGYNNYRAVAAAAFEEYKTVEAQQSL